MLMEMTTALTFASSLIAEVIEEVNANYGSPPFPDQEELEGILQQLNTYLAKNRETINSMDDACPHPTTADAS